MKSNIYFLFFETRVWGQRSTCLCFSSAEIKDLCHHCLVKLNVLIKSEYILKQKVYFKLWKWPHKIFWKNIPKVKKSWPWWYTLLMPALGRQKEVDLYVFESSPAWSTLGVWSTEELPSNTLPKKKKKASKQTNKTKD